MKAANNSVRFTRMCICGMLALLCHLAAYGLATCKCIDMAAVP